MTDLEGDTVVGVYLSPPNLNKEEISDGFRSDQWGVFGSTHPQQGCEFGAKYSVTNHIYILEIELSVQLSQGECFGINWILPGITPRLVGVILPHGREGILERLPDN